MVRVARRSLEEEAGDARVITHITFFLLDLLRYAPPIPYYDMAGYVESWLWIFILVSMLGVCVGNIRMIALSTLVTIMIPEGERDKANGQIGAVNGLVFTVVSVFSGFIIGRLGMTWAVGIVLAVTLMVIAHLLTLTFPPEPLLDDQHEEDKKIDIRGTIEIIAGISGLFAMIFFAMMNNFIGGIFMSLMDAYSLTLVSVETWGVILAFTSTGFILSGMIVARLGLGKNPVRTLLILNVAAWSVCIGFTAIPSIILTGVGMFLWMMIGPAAEASEQTIMQKIVPLERQGRVFGFGQSLENIASPLTAFMVGPLTQFLVIPWLASPRGNELFGGWWGTTPDRAMALIFVFAGLMGLIVTLMAFQTKSYRNLSRSYLNEKTRENSV